MTNELYYLLALRQVPKVGSVQTKRLIQHFGSAEAVFQASASDLQTLDGIGPELASRIRAFQDFKRIESELRYIEREQIQVHTYRDETFPQRLRHYENAPTVLFQRGNASLNPHRSVAIVGTRAATPRGRAICESLVQALKAYHVTIVSGLAYGIDVVAHTQSVAHGIPTLGVLAHGLDRLYPTAHRNIARQMLAEGGLITEFISGTRPDRERFPSRNRIIAGLSDAVIVVETRKMGGSMITADMAFEYNKDVFAVPGRLSDELSEGCNLLIKSHRAALLQSADDIAYIMGWQKQDEQSAAIQRQLFVELSDEERKVIAQLREQDMTTDALAVLLACTTSQVAALMLGLEFKGLVRPLPGSRFTLVR